MKKTLFLLSQGVGAVVIIFSIIWVVEWLGFDFLRWSPISQFQSCGEDITSLRREFSAATNWERISRELPELKIHAQVNQIAQLRAYEMAARGYGHANPEGDTAFTLMNLFGVQYEITSENISVLQSMQEAIQGLMSSEGHKENILSTEFTHFGVGVVTDARCNKYFTQIFLQPADDTEG
ncbi:hypothetical protein IID23_01585 [Patescibacteria group bacterium]|nr:hypothetical protein [Patescibacteria group bacterium]